MATTMAWRVYASSRLTVLERVEAEYWVTIQSLDPAHHQTKERVQSDRLRSRQPGCYIGYYLHASAHLVFGKLTLLGTLVD
jgi:hypothetical protein